VLLGLTLLLIMLYKDKVLKFNYYYFILPTVCRCTTNIQVTSSILHREFHIIIMLCIRLFTTKVVQCIYRVRLTENYYYRQTRRTHTEKII